MAVLRRPRSRSGAPGLGVNLQDARLSAAYRARLGHAGIVLSAWALEHGIVLGGAAQSPHVMSELLIAFLQDLFDLKCAPWLGTHAVLFVQTRWRHLKGKLRGAWDSVAAWNLQRPVCSRTPFPVLLLVAVARFSVYAAVALEPWKADLWWPFGVALQAAFFGLLRPGELYRLRRRDVRLPGLRSLLAAPVAVFTIREPKNRRFAGRLQVRAVRAPEVVEWLGWLLEDLPPDGLVWPHGPRAFGLCLEQALRFFGLSGLRLTPASLRAGGATFLFESGVSISNIRFAGSWSSERVLSHYLQEAEGAAAVLDVGPAAARRVEEFLSSFVFAARPPAVRWSALRAPWIQRAPAASSLPPVRC